GEAVDLLVNAQYQLGIAYESLGELEFAQQAHTEALQLRPDFAQGYHALANVQRDLGKTGPAIRSYSKAIALDEDFPQAYHALAALYAKMGESVQAIRNYEQAGKSYLHQATEAAPAQIAADAEILENALSVYQQAAQLCEQLLATQKVDASTAALSQTLARFRHQIGRIYQRQQQHERAIEQFRIAQNIPVPASVSPLSELELTQLHHATGLSYIVLGKPEHAIEAFHQVIEINRFAALKPDDRLLAQTYHKLGQVYASQNRFDAAIEMYQKALIFKPSDTVTSYHLGRAYEALRAFDEAIETYESIRPGVDTIDNITEAQYRLGETYAAYSLLDRDREKALLENALQNYNSAGAAYASQNRLPQALQSYQAVAQVYKRLQAIESESFRTPAETTLENLPQRIVVEAYLRSGDIYVGQGAQALALESYQAALALEPQRIQTLAKVGELYAAQGQWALVDSQYQQALVIAGQQLATRYYRQGLSYQAKQKYQEAIHAYHEALKLRELPTVHYQLGRIYDRQDQPNLALKHYEAALDLMNVEGIFEDEIEKRTLYGDLYFYKGIVNETLKFFNRAIYDFVASGEQYFEGAKAIKERSGVSIDFEQMNQRLAAATEAYKKVRLIRQSRIEMSGLESNQRLAEVNYLIARVHALSSVAYQLQHKSTEAQNAYDTAVAAFQAALTFISYPADAPESHPTLVGDAYLELADLYATREDQLNFAIKAYQDAGISYEDQRHFTKAIGAYQRILEINPNRAQTHFHLGRAYERQGVAHTGTSDEAFRTAVEYYTQVLEQGGDLPDSRSLIQQAKYGLARCYDYQGNYRKSVTAFTGILDMLWKRQASGLDINNTLLETAYRRISELGLEAVQQRNPAGGGLLSDAEIYYYMGLAAAYSENYVAAVDRYNRAIALEDNHRAEDSSLTADALRERGEAFTALGDFDNAYQSYNQAAQEYQRLKWYWEQQAYDYQATPIFDRDTKTLQSLMQQAEDAYQQAETAYQRAVGLRPDDAGLSFPVGLLYESRKKFQEAIAAYRDALEKSPEYAEALYRLGLIYAAQERYPLAKMQFQSIVNASLENSVHTEIPPILIAQSHAQLGLIADSEGALSIALAEYQLAARALPESGTVAPPDAIGSDSAGSVDVAVYHHYYEGLSHETQSRLGKAEFETAVNAYRKALDAYPAFGGVYYRLGRVYYEIENYELAKRQFASAIQLYQQSRNNDPDLANAYYGLGYTYYQTEDYESAWKQLHLAKANGKQEVSERSGQSRLALENMLRVVSIEPSQAAR
ncbi:MAG: tetratricopeptide repeat protein, partial [Candidatus Poribacteria bacterium]|nr:tetratricopeptide repeat protein [Candidatus Poribacteria bacterium]